MSLTRRQQEFLQHMAILQTEAGGQPVHYSALAERLGVSGMTAYDMLKNLERKGYVESRYHLPERTQRMGRSTIVYKLTAAGKNLLNPKE